MNLEGSYVYRKEVDWSLLHEGLTIPLRLLVAFKSLLDGYPHGKGRNVTLMLDGIAYPAMLINQKFDRQKYSKHADVVQIRFSPKSDISAKLQQIFGSSYEYLRKERATADKRKTFIRVPDGQKEYFVLYATAHDDLFYVETITAYELNASKSFLSNLAEEEFEGYDSFVRRDDSASIVIKPQLAKVRKLDRSIGEDLKALYKYRCQICGTDFGAPYDKKIVQVHHIRSFVVSMNNDYDNLMIICPNHHSVIHKAQPQFDRVTLTLFYPNGFEERLKVNHHFGVQ
jgi:5-methylcytosine-specific restriction endonuclease McrA